MRIALIKRYVLLLLVVACNYGATSVKTSIASGTCGREIAVVKAQDSSTLHFFRVHCVKHEGWDTMPEVIFWRRIITLSKDSSMANVFETRRLLHSLPRALVDSMEKLGKLDTLRAGICRQYNLPPDTRIKFTGGKKWFYDFSTVSTKLERAIELFDSFGVDPFYAQCVLLIESPGTNKAKSISGAYGHFQLMPFVARQYGLRVDNTIDERENFDRSAYAAARLFREICVPYARKWCALYGFAADESALWFKLLALHCYNAGATTVKNAMQMVPNSYQGNDLIHQLWHTNYGRFQSEAQNYSQIAVASYLEYEKYLQPCYAVSSQVYSRF